MNFISISINTDDSMEVVSRCFDAIRELIDALGKYFLTEDMLNEVLDAMRIVMEGEAMCQIPPDQDGLEDEEEEDDEEIDPEHDSKLLG